MLNSGGCSGTKCNDTAILGDGDHGTPALNVTAVHAWNKTAWNRNVLISFIFPTSVGVTGMNLYFYNNPSRNIGLPYDTDVTSQPGIPSFIEGNQDLSLNDNLLRNVTLIPRATIEANKFSIKFRFSNIDKIDWLLLTEVELCTSGIYCTLLKIIIEGKFPISNVTTVEPPIVDPPTKGHNIIDFSTKICFPIVLIHFEPPTRGQPLYKGHNS